VEMWADRFIPVVKLGSKKMRFRVLKWEDNVSGEGFFWQGNNFEVLGIPSYLRYGYIYIYLYISINFKETVL
jgi:hypothetical protein